MHTFHQYVLDQKAEKLKKHRVVVWYDPRAEFRPWIHELCGSEPLGCLHGHVCVFHGSFFEVRLTEALRSLRKHNFTEVIDKHFGLGSHLNARDRKAVRRLSRV